MDDQDDQSGQPIQLPSSYLDTRHRIDTNERDACALICAVKKDGLATHGNVKRTIGGLARMGHRSGFIDGEGDGVGILTDIPRLLWTKRLARAGLRASMATNRNFWVAHVMIPIHDRPRASEIIDKICREIVDAGLHVLYDSPGKTNRLVLGPSAEPNEPAFWQIVGMNGQLAPRKLDAALFDLQVRLENELGVHFPSFSAHSVVYKVQGTVEILRRYYPELRDPDYASIVTLGHARYSTNTNPVFERVQPFGLLGHNGEFNTISRFRLESAMLGIDLSADNSDSQDVDRALQALCVHHGLDLIEAMELIFPPYEHDLMQEMPELHQMYREMRHAFGPFAQGPAAVAARLGDLCVFSVDALGLRPLWFGETEKELFATSERGVYALDSMVTTPKPLSPGEKIALRIKPGHSIDVLDYPDIQCHVFRNCHDNVPLRANSPRSGNRSWDFWSPSTHRSQSPDRGGSTGPVPNPTADIEMDMQESGSEQSPAMVPVQVATTPTYPWMANETTLDTRTMAALGWERYHVNMVKTMAESQKDPIGSLGWDGPLAALSKTRVNIADFFKETVAVVTNPAIDREREQAQFSTRSIIGTRPSIEETPDNNNLLVEIETPLLLGGHTALGTSEDMRAVATQHGTMTLEDLLSVFGERAHILSTSASLEEDPQAAIERLQAEAIEAVSNGTTCLVLDDGDCYDGQRLWLDPLLVTAALDKALRSTDATPNLRRQTGIVVRSGALRDLHDLALCISLGANAILPYTLYAVALGIAPNASKNVLSSGEIVEQLTGLVSTLTKGIEKVTSTIGCHELRGYGHSFSSIGLGQHIADIFGTPNYFGSEVGGLTWAKLKADAEMRAEELRGERKNRLVNPDRFYPKVWKKVAAVALGEMLPEEYTEVVAEMERKLPVSIRHILGLREDEPLTDIENVDISIKDHSMPVLISAMSFGSQGELPYRAYADAAYRLNIICMNGEGGELPDMMGKYPRNRGQQIASGRFGVNIGLLNSCNLLEIKIGQGAKPGEGGHLPGFKVSEQVAIARNTTPGIALISPSNNHDLYSIEDLAQLIDELKTANPKARVSVKIPVVPGVGIIAVGVAKAGADVINITGFDGGTGAARAHALRHVGLPAEIGLWLAHRQLIESGMRDDVELWCDGGMRSGRDVVKMMCLGANRVGFGTLAMVAVGCTICRGCQKGTCHVGITTHIKTKEEAAEKGLKSFEPRDYQHSVNRLADAFKAIGTEIREWTARLGFTRAQDLVGRADLLEQINLHDVIDLRPLLQCAPSTPEKQLQPGGRRLTRPRNTLSKQITHIVTEQVGRGEVEMTYDDEQVMAMDRALGTHLSGAFQRGTTLRPDAVEAIHLSFSNSAIPGNGLAAFLDEPVDVLVEGGGQDGVGKCARGGYVAILKGLNHKGKRLDGSVGKSFAYGAQGGFFIVQGNADTRACIRLSGADVVFGGEIRRPLRDEDGGIGSRANLKGYAFEYMTAGRVMVLGDPGPWICAGMTGGAIYQRIQPEMGLTQEAIERRIAPGASAQVSSLNNQDVTDASELLNRYIKTLEDNHQTEAAEHLYTLLRRPQNYFVKISP
jgi:glutamate synthase (NADPH) large chain